MTKSSYETFRSLALGTKLWFRQSDIPAKAGEAPIAAIKVTATEVVIIDGSIGWEMSASEITGVSPEVFDDVKVDHKGRFFAWGLFGNDWAKLTVWTSDPTVKKARVKKFKPSLIGQRFTIMSLPEGMLPEIKVGMKGTMLTTGSESPMVVLDGYHRTVFIHVSHLGIHKKRRKMTMDRLPPQTKEVLSLLKAKGSLTAIEAGGVIRARSLAKRVSELKEAGVAILAETKFDHTGQRYARYHLQAAA